MPVLLTLSGAVLFLLTLVLVFIEFGEKSYCCGQYTFLSFFNLFLIIPVVVWTAIVVFPMGIYNEKKNPLSSDMDWYGGGFSSHHTNLKCDPVFWKHAYWFVCLLCVFEVGIIVAIFLKFCKVTCRCLKKGCCCCCENEEGDPEHNQIYALSQVITSENAENTLLIENRQETENLSSSNQVQEHQTSNETPFEAENLLPKVTKKELKKLTKDRKKAEELARLAAEAKAKAEDEAKAKAEAEEQAMIEEEVKLIEEAHEKAKREAEAKAKAAENEKEEMTVEKKEGKEETETTNLIYVRKARLARLEAEAKVKAEVEAKVKAEVEAKVKAEEQAKIEAETLAKKEAEAKSEAEVKAKAEAEEQAKLEAEQSQVSKQAGPDWSKVV